MAILLCAAAAIVLLVVLTRQRRSARGPALPSVDMPADQRIPADRSADEIARWIWKNLVPRSGEALTVQGELLRAVEKLRWEAQNNGNINWNEEFEKLIQYLHRHLVQRSTLPDDMKLSILADLARLDNFRPVDQLEDPSQNDSLPYIDDDLYDRLTVGVVAFSRLNTLLIPREADPE
jgi:hypothetical protein